MKLVLHNTPIKAFETYPPKAVGPPKPLSTEELEDVESLLVKSMKGLEIHPCVDLKILVASDYYIDYKTFFRGLVRHFPDTVVLEKHKGHFVFCNEKGNCLCVTVVGDSPLDGLDVLTTSVASPSSKKTARFDPTNLTEFEQSKISNAKMPANKTPHPPKVGDANSPIILADSESSGDMNYLCDSPDYLELLRARYMARVREEKNGKVLQFESGTSTDDWLSPLAKKVVVKKEPGVASKAVKTAPKKQPDVIDLMSSPESPESPSECADGLGMSQFAAKTPAQKQSVKAGRKAVPKPQRPKPVEEESKPAARSRPTRTRKATNYRE